MKYKNILVTGGAGFIGSFLVDALIEQGYTVRVFDNLEEQVHQGKIPEYLNKKAEFIKGDIRDYSTLQKALHGIDVVFHLAARVGVGQANYQIKEYTDVNVGGMANLLDILVNSKTKIKKILMTASMTSYGEGEYNCKTHGNVKPSVRSEEQFAKQDWDLHCPVCKKTVTPIPTRETASVDNKSIYALTKNVQEEMMHFVGKTYGIPTVSLRCFNVYGPRQSLSNPYTGVTAIFISRLKHKQRPVVYEDGLQTRDFVSVHDVVDALIKSMKSDKMNYQKINLGSGTPWSIKKIAELLATLLHVSIKPEITGSFRKGDIRHCYADVSFAKDVLEWYPRVSFKDGLEELILWSEKTQSEDLFAKAEQELKEKKLIYEKGD